ncbi:hypothetical protein [Burkholderia ubonensis]|uniref:hypothetical protein n=1 Tax=Burkholderia ubonensis TaxID=101571 RepID=UPI0007559BE9|nr:hypothetical protein [Burkholderia ubonensis]KVO18768.1 hypothetical protein WJ74_06415 [Burkholderia ubonensis]KWC05148.1 hypothetical protein WL44_25655 [Burkholderia ubonensis]
MKARLDTRKVFSYLFAFFIAFLASCSDHDDISGDGEPPASALAFRLDRGGQINAFYRQDKIAAHLLMRASTKPRLLVVFPAGNSGAGLWFDDTSQPVNWSQDTPISPTTTQDASGRMLYGIRVDVSADTNHLSIRQALLSSVRFLRDYNGGATVPSDIVAPPSVSGNVALWQRNRVDGAPGYALRVTAIDGNAIAADGAGKLLLQSPSGAPALRLRIEAFSGETPLQPITHANLFTPAVNPDPLSQNVFEFLSFSDKLLAGSWQYDTYFGRDTLISVRMLMPVLQPDVIEAGLGSVLSRLSPDGKVAHEEGIGEFALIDNRKHGRPNDPTPTYDYKMIDGDYMLAPIMEDWLIEDPRGQARAAAYLAQKGGDGVTNGSRFVANLLRVAQTAQPFAQQALAANLIHLRPGEIVGNWRDSTDGIGGGVYPYDVNVALVPAALRATSNFLARGLLDPYLSADQRAVLANAGAAADVWERAAPPYFQVAVTPNDARAKLAAYAPQAGVPAGVVPNTALQFDAIALDASGNPIPIMHSDGGFVLLFGNPSPALLARIVTDVMQPFPVGLVTDVGMLIANPAYADPTLWPRFTSSAYHGTVIWSWQQAMWVAGLDRQLARTDLPGDVRTLLTQARQQIWQVIANAKDMRSTEMWSWSYANGQYRTEAFGTRSADATEANAAQLWSTTYLAIQDPQLRAGKYWWEARAAGGDTPRRGSTETAAGNAANAANAVNAVNAVKGAAS